MTTQNNTLIHIMRMPLATVLAAYEASGGTPGSKTKLELATQLANQVDAGKLTLDLIRNAKPGSRIFSVSAAPAAPAVDADAILSIQRGVDATNQRIADVRDSLAKTFSADLTRLGDAIQSVTLGVESVRADNAAKLADIESKLAKTQQAAGSFKVDAGQIASVVASAVAAEFGSFKRAIEDAGLQQVAADLSAIHPTGTDTAQNVFGCPVSDFGGNDLTAQLWNSPAAPAVDPNFIWRSTILRHLLLSEQTGENLWFGGEKGAGKTQTAQQFAARTGRSFTRINFHKYTTAEEYIGSTALVGGNTQFAEGDFLRAYETPGSVILLDEITNAAPGELAPLNALLEPGAAVTIGGKVRRRATGVMIIAADNTLTNGDQSGRYSGTQQMNSALADRFSRVVPFKHLDFYNEVAAVRRHTGCTVDLAKAVIEMVNVCRQQVDAGNIVDAPSIRQIVAFIRALPVLGADEAFDTCIASRQPGESEVAINAIKAAHLNNNVFKG